MEKNRSDYYKLLRHTTQTGDFSDLVLYFLRGVQAQAEEGVERVEKIEKLMDEYERVVERSVPLRSHRLAQCIFSKPLLTIDYVQDYLGLSSRQLLPNILRQWKN